MKVEFSQFYCINCGKYVLDLPRKSYKLHKTGHLKKLYCPHCKMEVNCYECRTEYDVFDFKERFENREFSELAIASIEHCQGGK